MAEFHSKFITGVVHSVVSAHDRAEWRYDCYISMRDWMRENSIQGTKSERTRFTIAILKSIVRGVATAKGLNKEEHFKFAHDLKALWFKVKAQVKLENGSHRAEDIAMMNNTRREEEGISD